VKTPKITTTLLVAGVLLAPLLALLYLVNQLTGLPFPPFALFEWLVRVLPGPVVTFGIEALTGALTALGASVPDTAKFAEQGMAVGLFVVLALALAGLWAVLRARLPGETRVSGLWLGAALGLLIAVPVLLGRGDVPGAAWALVVFLGWGLLVGVTLRRLFAPPAADVTVDESRRRFLITLAGASAAVTVAGAGLSAVLNRRGWGAVAGSDGFSPRAGGPLPEADLEPAPGTRPEYTLPEDHYYVDLNMLPPFIDGDTWELLITGMVDREITLTLADFYEERLGEPVEEIITLTCISNRVGGRLIGTTRWTGIPLRRVLNQAGVQEGARFVRVISADNYYEMIPLDAVMEEELIMLTYLWNGEPLNVGHGYPVRMAVPGRYGMKQPKWIVRIEVTDEEDPGFWGQRGWEPNAPIKTTSVIDTVAVDSMYEDRGQMMIPIGGIAYAGARGISRVEVRVDDGEWQPARLRRPLSDLTWVIWRYDWPFDPGEHTFSVRAWDGTGEPQIVEESRPHPSGATGIHSVEVSL